MCDSGPKTAIQETVDRATIDWRRSEAQHRNDEARARAELAQLQLAQAKQTAAREAVELRIFDKKGPTKHAWIRDDLVRACRVVGVDIECAACAAAFFAGVELGGRPHDPGCKSAIRYTEALAAAIEELCPLVRSGECDDESRGIRRVTTDALALVAQVRKQDKP